MKTVTYKCNLCREEKTIHDLMCMYWESGVIPQQWKLSNDLQRSDCHVCSECIILIGKHCNEYEYS